MSTREVNLDVPQLLSLFVVRTFYGIVRKPGKLKLAYVPEMSVGFCWTLERVNGCWRAWTIGRVMEVTMEAKNIIEHFINPESHERQCLSTFRKWNV